MPKYRIGVWEEHSGFIEIIAKTEKEAEKKAYRLLENQGLDKIALEDVYKLDITHRDTHLV